VPLCIFGVSLVAVVWMLGDNGHYAFYASFIFAIGLTIRNWRKHKLEGKKLEERSN
jgi:hypothetical protein